MSLVFGGRLNLAFAKKIRMLYEHQHLVTHDYGSDLQRSSSNLVEKTVILYDTSRISLPDFLKKCQIEPTSQDQRQLANFILKIKSTHPKGTIFDGIRFGPVFWILKDFFHDVKWDEVLRSTRWAWARVLKSRIDIFEGFLI